MCPLIKCKGIAIFVLCLVCLSISTLGVAADKQVRGWKEQARKYYWGIGVKQDFDKAFSLYIKAANRGDVEAQYISGAMYQVGQGTAQNIPKSFHLLYGAAQKGKSTAESEQLIAQAFLLGNVVPKNIGKAIDWYTRAAAKGNADAQNELGFLYFSGREVEQDYEKASRYFRQAALSDYAVAQYNLGITYYKGFEGEGDLIKSYAWMSLAASNGHQGARKMLSNIEVSLTEEELAEAQLLSLELKETIEYQQPNKTLL